MTSNKLTFEEAFQIYLKSAFPIIIIPTREVDRATQVLVAMTKKWNDRINSMKLPDDKEHLKIDGYDMMSWDCLNGWRSLTDAKIKIPDTSKTPQEGLKWLIKEDNGPRPGVYIMQNAHMFFGDTYTLPELIQFFREHFEIGRVANRHLFLVGDNTDIPAELQPLTVLIDFPLPTRDELSVFITEYIDGLELPAMPKKIVAEAADAATGMTTHEVESAVCVAAVKSKGKTLDKQIIFEEKAKAVKRSGLLEHIPTDLTLSGVGGLVNFKSWLGLMSKPFLNQTKAMNEGIDMPRGVLVCGVSGTGKSLTAKAAANLFGVPLFRLDIGRVFGGLVGETEKRTRQLIQLMEAVSPCVILIDEIEKALAGLGSSDQSDSGVTARLFGALLTWLQEKTSPVFLIATANQVDKLPPEMLRKGRWDELFFVDLPSQEEREEILKIHLHKTGKALSKFPNFEKLAGDAMRGFTGAEIEAVVKKGRLVAFAEDREFTLKDVAVAVSQTVPLIKTKRAEIEALRAWANNKAVAANKGEVVRVDEIKTSKKASVFFDRDSETGDDVKALSKRQKLNG
jgi:ATP-dependent 26S proteasome regulatory subunit